MDAVWIVFLFALGACVGSFLNVVIYRLPRGLSIVFPGSHCPSCGRPIRWYDNLPLLSWFILRGRCRSCREPISPRYLVVEAAAAVLIAGLYVCYFVLKIRSSPGTFGASWPMFAAHAALLCSLLVCSIVDIQYWSVPLEVCWFASLVGVVSSAAAPHPWMPTVSPTAGAMSVAAGVGLALALVLQHYGIIQQSFLDADGKDLGPNPRPPAQTNADESPGATSRRIKGVAITKAHGVDPRREILRELVFLAPAILLAVGAYYLLTKVGGVREAWSSLTRPSATGRFALHFNGFLAALHGYLIGGLWVWGVRILGTLGFGKEAMGMGDAHILAAVGAVTGWIVPSIAFFAAPLLGLLWGFYVLLARKQHEVPYGPWLACAALAVMLFHDRIMAVLHPYAETMKVILR